MGALTAATAEVVVTGSPLRMELEMLHWSLEMRVVKQSLQGSRCGWRLIMNMILKSDGDDLKKMVKLFDEGKLKVCVDEHFAFDEVKEALSKSLTARSGGKLVIDVASPAPSETCCVVA
jgi:NADPH:quinone reductase-like Zn-dependent oxidoreductase